MLKPNTQSDEALGRWLCLEGGALINGIIDLITVT